MSHNLAARTAGAARLRALAALPVVAALSLTAACDVAFGAREEATATWTKSYPLSAGGLVDLSSTNGTIKVIAGSKPTVEIRAVKTAKAATKDAAEELLKSLELREDVTADKVKIRIDRPHSNGPSLHGWGTSTVVEYFVEVPANTKVVLATVNGKIEVTDVRGAARLETVNGTINARGLSGDVSANTVNGRVDIAFAAVTSKVEVGTTNGGVTVRLPADTKADLRGQTVNGGINVEDLKVEEVERSRRSLEAKMNGGGVRVEAETTNGGITFTRG
jgi:DUF4097 and DUF4098 domain-containing protein YvlB